MNAAPPFPSPSGPIKTYEEILATGTVQMGASTAPSIGLVFDTGAPSTELHAGSVITPAKFSPVAGQPFQVSEPGQDPFALLSFAVGQTPGVDQVGLATRSVVSSSDGYVNTGLNPFFKFPILFDIENGVMGFPALPSS